MEKQETIKPGWYKHFKGDVYEVVSVVMHTETLEKFVLYKHVNETNPGGLWVRPLEMFLGYKEMPDGTKVKRFEYVGKTKPK